MGGGGVGVLSSGGMGYGEGLASGGGAEGRSAVAPPC